MYAYQPQNECQDRFLLCDAWIDQNSTLSKTRENFHNLNRKYRIQSHIWISVSHRIHSKMKHTGYIIIIICCKCMWGCERLIAKRAKNKPANRVRGFGKTTNKLFHKVLTNLLLFCFVLFFISISFHLISVPIRLQFGLYGLTIFMRIAWICMQSSCLFRWLRSYAFKSLTSA